MQKFEILHPENIEKVSASKTYRFCDDLWIVTSYFNPAGFKTKKLNYQIFHDKITSSGLNCLTVECAFGDDPFSLSPSNNVLHVRCKDILWQKERLLNLAISDLPNSCTKVAWVDCDIIFENEMWAVETSKQLDSFPIVQPYKKAYRLPPKKMEYFGEGTMYESFSHKINLNPTSLYAGDFEMHGHTGFAWAARKDLLQAYGLYDRCIAGTGDHLMAHGFKGDWESHCVRKIVGIDNPYHASFKNWAQKIFSNTGGRVACVEGALLHLWHGDLLNRGYWNRNKELINLEYNPETDLNIDENGALTWASNRPALRKWAADYFINRDEDGETLNYGGY